MRIVRRLEQAVPKSPEEPKGERKEKAPPAAMDVPSEAGIRKAGRRPRTVPSPKDNFAMHSQKINEMRLVLRDGLTQSRFWLRHRCPPEHFAGIERRYALYRWVRSHSFFGHPGFSALAQSILEEREVLPLQRRRRGDISKNLRNLFGVKVQQAFQRQKDVHHAVALRNLMPDHPVSHLVRITGIDDRTLRYIWANSKPTRFPPAKREKIPNPRVLALKIALRGKGTAAALKKRIEEETGLMVAKATIRDWRIYGGRRGRARS
ncbi:MAG TPA: hypothetical protein VJI13_04555 [Candidatus Norongarragalinales archaeon]|nr:hypothetical protein [Candidatus Norongarragalinales archaeon]